METDRTAGIQRRLYSILSDRFLPLSKRERERASRVETLSTRPVIVIDVRPPSYILIFFTSKDRLSIYQSQKKKIEEMLTNFWQNRYSFRASLLGRGEGTPNRSHFSLGRWCSVLSAEARSAAVTDVKWLPRCTRTQTNVHVELVYSGTTATAMRVPDSAGHRKRNESTLHGAARFFELFRLVSPSLLARVTNQVSPR